jgi:EAL domain-containing protein (putative c-di-GMP-specific phosphodiesterase class I)
MVKLDRALVAGVAHDRHVAALIEAFVGYAAATGALVCAEGVEELDDLTALARLGVASAQGYGLARPAPGWTGLLPDAVAALRAGSADGAQALRQ